MYLHHTIHWFLKSCGDGGMVTGTGWGCCWKFLAKILHSGGLCVMVVCRKLEKMQHLYATWVTEHPSLRIAILSSYRERYWKGTLKTIYFTQTQLSNHILQSKTKRKDIFVSWNVHTLLDNDSRPEQWTAFVAKMLDKYIIDIAALKKY